GPGSAAGVVRGVPQAIPGPHLYPHEPALVVGEVRRRAGTDPWIRVGPAPGAIRRQHPGRGVREPDPHRAGEVDARGRALSGPPSTRAGSGRAALVRPAGAAGAGTEEGILLPGWEGDRPLGRW